MVDEEYKQRHRGTEKGVNLGNVSDYLSQGLFFYCLVLPDGVRGQMLQHQVKTFKNESDTRMIVAMKQQIARIFV